MRIIVFLALVPAILCQQLEVETLPRPARKGFSTIYGTCDPTTGIISGASFVGKDGTLKSCTQKCADNAQCKGLNFVTDQNQCQLFRQECADTVKPVPGQPNKNFYLKGEIACSTSTVGNEFYLAFMANRVAQPKNMSLEIWITQDRSLTPTTVKVDVDASQSLTETSISVPYKKAVLYKIPFTWKVSDVDNGITIEKKALKLSSDTDFVFYGVNKEYFTADAYLGIPSRALGTRYVANCHWPPFYNCEFAITPTTADTVVTITLPKAQTRNVGNWAKAPTGVTKCAIPYKGRTYTNGDSFKITLQEFDVAQIQDPCDLTGTIIESDKPVAVWSGDSRVNIGDSPSRDHQVEELFSTDTWGTDCAAWPTPNRVEGLVDYWVITAAEDATAVLVESSEKAPITYNLNSGESVRFPANSVREYQRFSSKKKFQAVQYASSAVDNSIPGDPSMTICIPSDQFGFGYTFVTPTGVSSPYTNYLTIITVKSATNGFILDGQPVTGVTWTDFPNSNLVAGVVKLDSTKQQFRIEHRVKGTTFEAYIYGSGDRESIAYPTGACIQALGECVPSTMFVGDGKDNDCDGVIDEEYCDGVDNDLDGKVDEDCYERKPVAQDRCPDVKFAQACYNSQVQLSCESGSIHIVSAHLGRLNRAGEIACGGESTMNQCTGTDGTCGYLDAAPYMRSICNGQQSCSSPVNAYTLGNIYYAPTCPTCALYLHVQYACLNQREITFGELTGQGYTASSWLASGASGTCSAGADKSCPGCDAQVSAPASIYRPAKADHAYHGRHGWRPAACDDEPWLQVDLGGIFSVGWYAVSGCRMTEHWTTSFGLAYSTDGVTFKEIREANGALRSFTANSDSLKVKICTIFGQNIVARYIRVIPLSYNNAPCMHIDFGHNGTLQGCAYTVPNGKPVVAAFGATAKVQCEAGWATPSGVTSYDVQCGTDGQWATAFRPCSKFLTCPDIPAVDGGYSVAANNQVGSIVQFTCLGGRRLRGANKITCNPDGKWSADAPTCEQL